MHFAPGGKLKVVAKAVLSSGLLIAVFWLGVGVGNGTINFGRDQAIRRSVQKNLPEDLAYTSVEEVYDNLRKSFDGELDEQKLLDGLKEGLAKASGDSYTEFLNPEAAKEFDEQLNGSFEGIGAELDKEERNIIIVAPLAGFPAEKAGLQPRDIIAEINGESAYDLNVSEAVKKIRGPKGTKVKLTIVRDNKVLEVEITRETITIPSVESEILEGNIGYLKISRFGDDTAGLSSAAADKFKNSNVKGIIVDLRNNPGGLLDSSVDVSSLWLNNKKVLEERRGNIIIKTYNSHGSAKLAGIPTVVLINEGSASASEIVAGALKDHKAATILGVKSFGKGSVQNLLELRAGGLLKVTIARWYTPSGRNIDKDGIEPDQKVEISDQDLEAKRDPQRDAAIAELNKR